MLATVRRASFLHEAPGVIAFMETPTEETVYDQYFWVRHENLYKQQLRPADAASATWRLHAVCSARTTSGLMKPGRMGEPGQIGYPRTWILRRSMVRERTKRRSSAATPRKSSAPSGTTGEGALLQCARCPGTCDFGGQMASQPGSSFREEPLATECSASNAMPGFPSS